MEKLSHGRGVPWILHFMIFVCLLSLFHINVVEPLVARFGFEHLVDDPSQHHHDRTGSSVWSPTWVHRGRALRGGGAHGSDSSAGEGESWELTSDRGEKAASAGPESDWSTDGTDVGADGKDGFDDDFFNGIDHAGERPDTKGKRSRNTDKWTVLDEAKHGSRGQDQDEDWESSKAGPKANVPPELEAAAIIGKLVGQIVDFVMRFAIEFAFAYVYKRNVVDRKRVLNPVPNAEGGIAPGFKHPLCDCLSDLDICFHTFCCFHVRVADTYHGAGVMDYWMTFLMAMICSPCFIICLMPCKRGEIRSKVIGGPPTCSCEDCLLAFFCAGCIACQEARAVDEVLGVRTKCCCKLMAVEDTRVPLVGEVVTVTNPQVVATAVQGVQPAIMLQPPQVPFQQQVVQAQAAQALHFAGREMQAGTYSSPEAPLTSEALPQPGQDAEMQPLQG